jgi:uncharacterized membrane protein HdeD (DUF308 family)
MILLIAYLVFSYVAMLPITIRSLDDVNDNHTTSSNLSTLIISVLTFLFSPIMIAWIIGCLICKLNDFMHDHYC